jgi:hypothetical protein
MSETAAILLVTVACLIALSPLVIFTFAGVGHLIRKHIITARERRRHFRQIDREN